MLLRFLPCLLALWAASPLGAAAANISVNAASQVNTFKPANIFGNNVAYWAGTGANNATQGRVQAAGNYLIRYPGGSSSDDFHWNGNGSLDANGYWVPSNTNYSPSVVGTEKYRGTKSSYGPNSNLTDGNAATAWKSNADTDYPTSQWVYLDLGSTGSVSQVVITWGTPWATNFSLQTGSSTYNATSSNWTSIPGATNLAGVTGSAQTINFSAVSTRYIRILMTASSAGAGGAYSIAEVAVYNGSTAYTLTSNSHVASSTDPACTISGSAGFDFESYMSYIHLFTPQAQPLITVNFGEGTPQEAAAWVHYANVVKGYGIKYWEIGNELDGSWETGGPLPAEDYARRYIEFYEAMKAEDPTITVMGPVVSQPGNVANDFTGTSYIQAFVNRLASDSGGNKAAYANGIAFHWYPTWNNDMSNVAGVLANPSGWASLASNMSSWLVNHPAPSTVPIFLTEFNSGGTGNVTTDITNGLWYADWMGQMITKFGSRGYSTMWDVLNGGNAVTSPTGGDHAYLQAEANIYQYQQRAH